MRAHTAQCRSAKVATRFIMNKNEESFRLISDFFCEGVINAVLVLARAEPEHMFYNVFADLGTRWPPHIYVTCLRMALVAKACPCAYA